MAVRGRCCWALALGFGLGQPACSETGPRIYTGRPYQAAAACFGPSVALGVVEAEELGSTCSPVCLLLDETLYVSVVCPPYPSRTSLLEPADAPGCALALMLFEANRSCRAAPSEPDDAGDGGGPDSAQLEP